jgi:hypothetical protein
MNHSPRNFDDKFRVVGDDWLPPPLALADWLKRKLPSADLLLPWLSTTSRVLFPAPTGIGKTMFGIGLGMRCAAGSGFLHWPSIRPARTLLIDGEMSRRLSQQRLKDEAKQLGREPDGFHILSHEDVENFRPLNTPEGQAFIEEVIKRIGSTLNLAANVPPVDLIIFDNVMCLLAGNMKDTEQWAATMPWVKSLTRRCIGQIWLHHTNEEGRTYGDKTREFQMDTVIIGEEVKRPDTDVSFRITFPKARERTPANRAAFADANIALVNDRWTSDLASASSKRDVSPLGIKFLSALVDATIGSGVTRMSGCPTATLDQWRAECIKLNLIGKGKETERTDRSLFDKYKRELIGANRVVCNETMAWTL